MSDRWPWDLVRGFKAESLADGTILVTPEYSDRIQPYKEGEGGGPGLFLRMDLAEWVQRRLAKRGSLASPGDKSA